MAAIAARLGEGITVRALERSDGELLRSLFYRLSPESIYRRFLSPIQRPDQAHPDRLLDIDHVNREAIGAFDGQWRLIGVARYARVREPATAEIAIVVADACHRQGVGAELVRELEARAAAAGIDRFRVVCHADNRPALALLLKFHPDARLAVEAGFAETTVAI